MDNKSVAGIDRRGFFASIGAALLAPLAPITSLGKLDFGGKFSVGSAGNAMIRPMAGKLCSTALPAVGSAGAFVVHEWSGKIPFEQTGIFTKAISDDEVFQSFSINTDEVT